jgi:hypothetical protein
MAESGCAHCKLREKYDSRPKSFAGRVWRWHINFCPGWKRYFTSLPSEEREELAAKYDFRKYQ